MLPSAASPRGKISIHVLSGFLGSGKTTFLNHWLPQLPNTAVILNEFGEVGVDHWLVDARPERKRVVAGGCLCCSVREDLVTALESFFHQRRKGEGPDFKRVVIETSGLADPGPVLRTLLMDEFTSAHFQLANLIVTVDAVHGLQQLGDHDESVKQAALANVLILTKSELVPPPQREALRQRLAALNPEAKILLREEFTREDWAWDQGFDPTRAGKWLGAEAYVTICPTISSARHDAHVRGFCLEWPEALSWAVWERWLQQLTRLRGKDLLRVKGLLRCTETPLPVVLQGVQHLFQPPTTLPAWPEGETQSKIVFITRNIEPTTVKEHLAAVMESDTPVAASQAAMLLLGQTR